MLISKLATILKNHPTATQAKQVHALMIINSLHNLEPLLVHQILLSARSYSRRIAQYVQRILFNLQNPDSFSWGCAIRYFSQQGRFNDSLSLYRQMQRLGLCPSTFAVSSALRACARIVNKVDGTLIHAQSYKYGFCGSVYVRTSLLDFYSKVGDMETAQKVFDEMVEKNVVSWNSILSGYLKSGNFAKAQKIFDQIPMKDVISWNSMISGYASMGDMEKACLLFQQMPYKSHASWNTIISGYVDCGNMELARKLFDVMPQRNGVSWTTMISGYSKCGDVESARKLFDQSGKKDMLVYSSMITCFAQNSRPKEALQLFNEMLKSNLGMQPDEMTLASAISACSQLGDLKSGSWIESYINNIGMEMNDHLVTALVDLYAKCGNIDRAYELFDALKKKDVVAYSAMIFGCGINGKAADAVKLFEAMVNGQIRPNLATFTGLLTAYNHAGLVEESYQCFNSIKNYELTPSRDHYAIMVDLLGRAGRLQEAYELIKSMPMQPHVGIWGALLLACSVHNNVEFGEIAAQHCFELEPNTRAYYSLLANIFASNGRWDDAKRLRKEVEKKKMAKMPGCSWTELT